MASKPEEWYAEHAICSEGEIHEGTPTEMGYECPKCLERVNPIVNARGVSGWPALPVFYVDYDEDEDYGPAEPVEATE